MKVVDSFLRYVKIDTQSKEEAECFPSTEKQKDLARLLVEELTALGAADVRMDEYGYVYAVLPSNLPEGSSAPAIGFIAHMDTAPAVSGSHVNPRIVENYNGEDIVLNESEHVVLKTVDFPEIVRYIGKDLIVTDGTTLLGADDKAGIAEIMTMAEELLTHPEILHGKICIGFTPDEEVGAGADHFDVKGFGADFAYTVDGDVLGSLEYENFNAAGVKLTIHGRSVHPGEAKGKMKNALLLGMEFQSMLPVFENPMYTEGYEGFYHLDEMKGCVEEAVLTYIIRDHDKEKFLEKKERFMKTADFLNEKYGEDTFIVDMKDSYYNMKEQLKGHMHLIENAKQAMEEAGVVPNVMPIRGGTDGARLSYMGLPCPNLCTGGHNFHGKYEYICIQSMEKIVEILLNIISHYR